MEDSQRFVIQKMRISLTVFFKSSSWSMLDVDSDMGGKRHEWVEVRVSRDELHWNEVGADVGGSKCVVEKGGGVSLVVWTGRKRGSRHANVHEAVSHAPVAAASGKLSLPQLKIELRGVIVSLEVREDTRVRVRTQDISSK